jgi:hypothetical protein
MQQMQQVNHLIDLTVGTSVAVVLGLAAFNATLFSNTF